jgi:hypothetical protein
MTFHLPIARFLCDHETKLRWLLRTASFVFALITFRAGVFGDNPFFIGGSIGLILICSYGGEVVLPAICKKFNSKLIVLDSLSERQGKPGFDG